MASIRGGSYSVESCIISGGKVLALQDVKLLTPCQLTRIDCLDLNYAEHAQELKMQLPEEAIITLKPPSAALGLRRADHLSSFQPAGEL